MCLGAAEILPTLMRFYLIIDQTAGYFGQIRRAINDVTCEEINSRKTRGRFGAGGSIQIPPAI